MQAASSNRLPRLATFANASVNNGLREIEETYARIEAHEHRLNLLALEFW
jgi:hypothetical protein